MKTRFLAILLIASLAGSAIPGTALAEGFLERLFGNATLTPTTSAPIATGEELVVTLNDSFLTDGETKILTAKLWKYRRETGKTVKLYVGGGIASARYLKELRSEGIVYGKGTDIALYVTLSPNNDRKAIVQFAGPIYRSRGKVVLMKEENSRDAIGYMVEILLKKTKADAVD